MVESGYKAIYYYIDKIDKVLKKLLLRVEVVILSLDLVADDYINAIFNYSFLINIKNIE